MPQEAITLQISGETQGVPLDLLIEKLEEFVKALRALDARISGSGKPLKWEIIQAKMASPLALTMVPVTTFTAAELALPEADRLRARKETNQRAKTVVKKFAQGVRQIERSGKPPEEFDDKVIEATRKLFAPPAESGGAVEIDIPKLKPIAASEKLTMNIERIVGPSLGNYVDEATIEGKLEVISVRGNDHVSIEERLTGNRIECQVTKELLEIAKAALGKRVAVTGLTKYRENRPLSMVAERIAVLRESNDLPQLSDIGPVNITDGLSPEEYVRRMRDAE